MVFRFPVIDVIAHGGYGQVLDVEVADTIEANNFLNGLNGAPVDKSGIILDIAGGQLRVRESCLDLLDFSQGGNLRNIFRNLEALKPDDSAISLDWLSEYGINESPRVGLYTFNEEGLKQRYVRLCMPDFDSSQMNLGELDSRGLYVLGSMPFSSDDKNNFWTEIIHSNISDIAHFPGSHQVKGQGFSMQNLLDLRDRYGIFGLNDLEMRQMNSSVMKNVDQEVEKRFLGMVRSEWVVVTRRNEGISLYVKQDDDNYCEYRYFGTPSEDFARKVLGEKFCEVGHDTGCGDSVAAMSTFTFANDQFHNNPALALAMMSQIAGLVYRFRGPNLSAINGAFVKNFADLIQAAQVDSSKRVEQNEIRL